MIKARSGREGLGHRTSLNPFVEIKRCPTEELARVNQFKADQAAIS
jgi:hypothetical protein